MLCHLLIKLVLPITEIDRLEIPFTTAHLFKLEKQIYAIGKNTLFDNFKQIVNEVFILKFEETHGSVFKRQSERLCLATIAKPCYFISSQPYKT